MKKILFTLLLFCAVGLMACRKSGTDIDIKQFDEQEIQNYIKTHNLTGFARDAGDTTGIYYKTLSQGTGSVVDYPDLVSIAFTVSSFDGKYILTDTIANHIYNYLGHITQNQLPEGVELIIRNFIKNKGGRIHALLPSHLAYGIYGYGTGSSEGSNRLAGNQCLDMYIHLIGDNKGVDDLDTYDDQSIKAYMAANNLSGYTQTPSGLYYKITQTTTGAAVTPTSNVTIQFTGYLLNGLMTYDEYNATDGSGQTINIADSDSRKGIAEGLLHTVAGEKLSLIMPSRLAFGISGDVTNLGVPPFACMRYEINVISVQ